MDYDIKIVMVTSSFDSFNRVANTLCARVIEQGYRFNSASSLSVQEIGGKAQYSQTFIFEKGAKNA